MLKPSVTPDIPSQNTCDPEIYIGEEEVPFIQREIQDDIRNSSGIFFKNYIFFDVVFISANYNLIAQVSSPDLWRPSVRKLFNVLPLLQNQWASFNQI